MGYKACMSGDYPSPECSRSCSESGYSGDYNSDKVKASSSYSVFGVSQIQTELMTNGPLYVAFTVYGDFETYKSGVYKHTTGGRLGGHAVEMIGWGTEDGEDYWWIKNSWNEEWGDGGLFKIARGVDECGIESSVSGGLISGSPSPSPSPTPSPAEGSCIGTDLQADCEGTTEQGAVCTWCDFDTWGDCMPPSFACSSMAAIPTLV